VARENMDGLPEPVIPQSERLDAELHFEGIMGNSDARILNGSAAANLNVRDHNLYQVQASSPSPQVTRNR
jgi:hypothetical protein